MNCKMFNYLEKLVLSYIQINYYTLELKIFLKNVFKHITILTILKLKYILN